MRLLSPWLLVLTTTVAAQNIVATNSTNSAATNDFSPVALAVSDGSHEMAALPSILPLTKGAADDTPPPGLSGPAIAVTPANQIGLLHTEVALISCDQSDYAGLIDADSLFKTAIGVPATAIIFYSRQSASCALSDYTASYQYLYTTTNASDAATILEKIGSSSAGSVWLSIGRPDLSVGTSNNSSSSSTTSSSNSTAPPTNQTVAMIILYSVTGIITVIFLGIIITGAVRAQRHPERYGPRYGPGRPRQSRARGLARAMLDSLPIVKVGESEEPKQVDVELQENQNAAHVGTTPADAAESPLRTREPSDSDANADEGNEISAAASPEPAPASPRVATREAREAQGCSICTDDFEIGQDQRVLPCNHRFHPACVDPWLLNVASTCPLCRIDLRPGHMPPDADGEIPEGDLTAEYARTVAEHYERNSRLRNAIVERLGDHRLNRSTRIGLVQSRTSRFRGREERREERREGPREENREVPREEPREENREEQT